MGFCQNPSGIDPCRVHIDTLYGGIRAGKVDVFEDTGLLRSAAAAAAITGKAVLINGDDLTGKQIPLKGGTHRAQSAAFRRDHIGAIRHLAIA